MSALEGEPLPVSAKSDAIFVEDRDPAEEPKLFGRYVVLGPLGRGGMGTVLEAFDRTLDRRVAVKVLNRDLGPQHTQRLLREAQALAKLSHPNVVQVYEVGEVDGQAYIAMELVRGQSLRAWMRRVPPRSWQECVELYIQVGRGLAAAHNRGLVHRDFKPGNAVVDEGGRARVLDFGLARYDHEEEPPSISSDVTLEGNVLDTSLTRTGTVLGTPAYMPLEQMRGAEADARSDQFSFCVSLYEAIFGERPFEGTSIAALSLSMSGHTFRPTPKGVNAPSRLVAVLRRGLSTTPSQRWPSMDALLVELERLTAGRARRWAAVGLFGGLLAVGVGLAQFAEVGLRCEGARLQLEGVRDEARAKEVEAAIVDTELSYAADTWHRVEQRLGDYSEAWVVKHGDVCEATRVSQEQTEEVMGLRMGCLSSRRLDLQAAVDVLARTDEARLEHAVDVAVGLPDLTRCDDIEALRSEVPPPDGPEVAAEVEVLRGRLADSAALERAGDYLGSAAAADAVVDEAQRVGYEPLLAEALLRRGKSRRHTADFAASEADLERAFRLALQHRIPFVGAQASSGLIDVVGKQQAEHERGLWWGTVAESLALRSDTGNEHHLSIASNLGTVLLAQG